MAHGCLKMIRCLAALVWCTGLIGADLSRLRELEEKNRFFELRRELERAAPDGNDVLYYRAVTAGRFGREKTAIIQLRAFLAAKPTPEIARKAHEEMAAALVRIGLYGEAAREWSEALLLTPQTDNQRADNENSRVLYDSLRGVAPQTIEFGPDVPMDAQHNRVGSWDVPVEVNGQKGEGIFDTGANISTLSESEAARLGLAVRETRAYVGGSTEKKNPLRLAVAADLHFGPAHLRNVVFLVIADQALYVGPLKYQIRGILGLPVLRALRKVGISGQGRITIDRSPADASGNPNLFFDELTPIVEVQHGNRQLQMFLDTGANKSDLYPSFRVAMGEQELAKLKNKKQNTAGAGGAIKLRTQIIPSLRIEILGRPVDIPNAGLRTSQPAGTPGLRDGVIGMDALSGGFTIDFQTMQLQLE